jgi:glycyl-tRNA synthetase beta chain
MNAPQERQPFLLEIGSEEIPARFIPTSREEIAARLEAILDEEHLAHGPLRTVATPRRLAVLCADLAVRQPDRDEELKGPPVRIAFDADGKPTRAAEGFARKLGVDLADCGRGEDERGEHLLVQRRIAGRSAAEVLGERLPGLILDLPFRKTMRWADLDLEYARPLQWLACLLGDEVVEFAVGPLRSGRQTRGHRTLTADARRDIAAAGEYEQTMDALQVVVDPQRRRETIVAQAGERLAAAGEGARLREDPWLLDEVVDLCEHPTAFVGRFEPEFFDLPPEVIVTALKEHQRYFAVTDADAQLLPAFVAVRDGGEDHLDTVREGNERVLRARLADALFYWRFDQQRSPEEHAAALASVTWIEGLGSVADQVRRTGRLAERLWRDGLGEGLPVPAELQRAAALLRFDLVTEMIKDGKEFTRLEGLIAARYAAAAGESAVVCRALEQAHWPRGAGDALPEDRIGSALSVASRLDTLAGCWLAGFEPTGAKDPYALRRHALALLRILVSLRARVDLRSLLDEALAPFADLRPEADLGATREAILGFIGVRLEGWLLEARGLDLQVVRAVLPIRGQDPADAVAWAEALEKFRERDDFLLLARGFKRCTNILQGEVLPRDEREAAVSRWQGGGRGSAGEDLSGLPDPAERTLRDAVAAAVPAILASEAAGDYVAVFQTFAGFGPVIDRFFDEVRVNTEDAELRGRRHAFLREIHALFLRYADFARVAPED